MGGGSRAEGTQAEGCGAQSAPIAVIAVIAGIARDRNAKAKPYRGSTRMNADQEIGLGMGWDEGIAVIAGIARDRKSKGKTYRG